MLLRNEKGIEIPETGLNEVVGRHLRETHLKEDLSELMTDFHDYDLS